jgi:hypothetical protein
MGRGERRRIRTMMRIRWIRHDEEAVAFLSTVYLMHSQRVMSNREA